MQIKKTKSKVLSKEELADFTYKIIKIFSENNPIMKKIIFKKMIETHGKGQKIISNIFKVLLEEKAIITSKDGWREHKNASEKFSNLFQDKLNRDYNNISFSHRSDIHLIIKQGLLVSIIDELKNLEDQNILPVKKERFTLDKFNASILFDPNLTKELLINSRIKISNKIKIEPYWDYANRERENIIKKYVETFWVADNNTNKEEVYCILIENLHKSTELILESFDIVDESYVSFKNKILFIYELRDFLLKVQDDFIPDIITFNTINQTIEDKIYQLQFNNIELLKKIIKLIFDITGKERVPKRTGTNTDLLAVFNLKD